ncbi:hypothetical protein QBC33DRAFT_512184 [Phialemonium atrogriseum]|uniref:Uncharacterized protein n=1 Tax=Phialemonium atrogriseum TaxID=1093897 RepID=A0AAJ0C5A2_9PEZI|nr:uncharacterized protein QBC33DRAFT_512184 [Phialemonium atrogriseum]KAK1770424.1 hypothetical protein QBC33DRAFT_512184 [Phialemonium atrogriseum]
MQCFGCFSFLAGRNTKPAPSWIPSSASNQPSHEIERQATKIVDTEALAKAVLRGIEETIKAYQAMSMNTVLREAIETAQCAAEELFDFAREHPVFVTIVAIGVLALLAPWAVEALGFGELGPVEASFAALWQSTYRGLVPKGSLFSFFQRLGMIWGRA